MSAGSGSVANRPTARAELEQEEHRQEPQHSAQQRRMALGQKETSVARTRRSPVAA
jgi:hypothetical protein